MPVVSAAAEEAARKDCSSRRREYCKRQPRYFQGPVCQESNSITVILQLPKFAFSAVCVVTQPRRAPSSEPSAVPLSGPHPKLSSLQIIIFHLEKVFLSPLVKHSDSLLTWSESGITDGGQQLCTFPSSHHLATTQEAHLHLSFLKV